MPNYNIISTCEDFISHYTNVLIIIGTIVVNVNVNINNSINL